MRLSSRAILKNSLIAILLVGLGVGISETYEKYRGTDLSRLPAPADVSPDEIQFKSSEAVAQGDEKAIEYPAHTLKSNCGFLGAKQLMSLCETMELMARKGSIDRAPQVLSEIEAEFPRVESALQAELSEVREKAS